MMLGKGRPSKHPARKRDRDGPNGLRGAALNAAPFLILAGFAALDEQMRSRQAGDQGHKRRRFGHPHAPSGLTGRAAQPGRGRAATTPTEIPPRGWKDILLRVKNEIAEDQLPLIAAGVTFFTVLAIFPGLAAFVSVYGLFADTHAMSRSVAGLSHILPGGAVQVITDQLERLTRTGAGGLSVTFLISLLTSIWSANGAVKSLMVGLNVAYGEHERRGLLRKTLTSLAFTFGFLIFGVGATTVLGLGVTAKAAFGDGPALLLQAVSWPVLLVSLGVGLALLYRYGPSRDPVRLRWISWGSAAAVFLWLVVSAAFTLYVANFGHYNKTYGSLGAAVGFMTWIWLSCMVVLAGAELNAEIEHQTAVDTTEGPPQPMGARRARMADEVGAAQGR